MITIMGITDEYTACDKCGKNNLKKSVILNIDGEIKHYGCDCAGQALYGKKTSSNTSIVKEIATWISWGKKALATGTWEISKLMDKLYDHQAADVKYVNGKRVWVFCGVEYN